MNKNLLLFSLLTLLLYVPNVTLGIRGNKVCVKKGLLCETCTTLINCEKQFQPNTGQYLYVKEKVVETCKSNQWCNDAIATPGCVSRMTNPDPFCEGVADLPFRCMLPGVFPNIYVCTKYVVCIQEASGVLRAYDQNCEPGFRYNVNTKSCDLPLTEDNPCPGFPLVTCNGLVTTDAVAGSRSLYYKCERRVNGRLIPDIYRCLGNEIWSTGGCSEPVATTPSSIAVA